MQTPPTRIGCIECDRLVVVDPLAPGERASCPRCGHVLRINNADGLTRALAFCLAAGVLLALSMALPFLSLKSGGIEQVMTLPGSAYELWAGGYPLIALIVMGPIILVPTLMIVTLVALLVPLRASRRASWLVPAGRVLFFLTPWSMVEVFVIAVIVSLVKIGSLATVVLGISFWAYVAFALCFTATLTNLDRVAVWERIEGLAA